MSDALLLTILVVFFDLKSFIATCWVRFMQLIPIDALLDLTGKTAIVTGAVGIGYGIAYRLAEAGAKVAIASLHKT